MSISSQALRLTLIAAAVTACSGSKPETAPAPAPERPAAATAGSASTVSADAIERTPRQSIEKYLEGRVAGVVVGQAPGGGLAVRIRGASSFSVNEEPLYILDGMPIAAGPGGALVGLNPYDIESIRVLKGPTETALYGSRGANGVIVIKTKQGTQKKPD